MAYTVKQLSSLSGVTVRALHFYEEAALLKPAYYGANGYRYYEEKELLQLQQILFFKELGFSLRQIQKVLGKGNFDKLAALHSHKQAITNEWMRLGRLIETIDQTIKHLKGEKTMKSEEMYIGFVSKEKQAEYEIYLKNRFGADNPAFVESEQKAKKLTKIDHERYRKAVTSNMKELAQLMQQGLLVASVEVQACIRQHYHCITTFWTPTRESFSTLGQMYTEFEWKTFFQPYDPHHPRLATFLAEAMKLFAERELS